MPSKSALNALQLLRSEHMALVALCDRLARSTDHTERRELAGQLRHELEIHTILEGEIFYPALKTRPDSARRVEHAFEEHAEMEAAAEHLEGFPSGDPGFMRSARLLADRLRVHFCEEETELFGHARHSALDLDAMGQEMAARKQAILTNPEELELAPAG
jgi:hypothetical protein